MSGSEFDTAVFGDGVITLQMPSSEKRTMADIPASIAENMAVLSMGQIQQGTGRVNGVFDAVMGAIAGTVQTNFAEVGVLEGRAVSGVNATDLGAPSPKVG